VPPRAETFEQTAHGAHKQNYMSTHKSIYNVLSERTAQGLADVFHWPTPETRTNTHLKTQLMGSIL